MAIKDLEIRQGKVDIVVEIVEKGEIREFQKFGRTGRVCNAKVKDETGEISLTLWNEQIDQVNPGDKVHITNGYVSEFQGEKQLTTGKFGKLEVVEKGGGSEESKEIPPASEETAAEETAEEPDVEGESIEEENIE
jgi:replication factor A1